METKLLRSGDRIYDDHTRSVRFIANGPLERVTLHGVFGYSSFENLDFHNSYIAILATKSTFSMTVNNSYVDMTMHHGLIDKLDILASNGHLDIVCQSNDLYLNKFSGKIRIRRDVQQLYVSHCNNLRINLDRINVKKLVGLIPLGMFDPRGYKLYAHILENKEIRYLSGCRYFTYEEAIEHWSKEVSRREGWISKLYVGLIKEAHSALCTLS